MGVSVQPEIVPREVGDEEEVPTPSKFIVEGDPE